MCRVQFACTFRVPAGTASQFFVQAARAFETAPTAMAPDDKSRRDVSDLSFFETFRAADDKCDSAAARRSGPGRRRRPKGRSGAKHLDATEHGGTMSRRRQPVIASSWAAWWSPLCGTMFEALFTGPIALARQASACDVTSSSTELHSEHEQVNIAQTTTSVVASPAETGFDRAFSWSFEHETQSGDSRQMVVSTAVICFSRKPSTANCGDTAVEEFFTREIGVNCNSRRLNDFHIETKRCSGETFNIPLSCISLML